MWCYIAVYSELKNETILSLKDNEKDNLDEEKKVSLVTNEEGVEQDVEEEKKEQAIGKKLYDYQVENIKQIFERFQSCPPNYKLLYQLPTGGGKTVIFSEIARRYIEEQKKKVLILTHRIELCGQTSRMLNEFNVSNMIIDSKVKELPPNHNFTCFVAMVETLNNRLNDEKVDVSDVGLVIIDEAHNNSFRKLFKFFQNSFLLGVTATPLSSNITLPMKDSYQELIVGSAIMDLVTKGFLAKAETYIYDVGLGSLKIGMNGDYTVRSSEILYSNSVMQGKLLMAYTQRAKGKKTLIFNNGINTSRQVYETMKGAGYDVRHLDNTHSKQQRKEILAWFKEKKDAILTSVGILTTGFDEPTVETIIINRATRSLSLYFQMIGRGSRVLPEKDKFDVIDLGNNVARFGLWSAPVDWQRIFRYPNLYLDNLISDEDIERKFRYVFTDEQLEKFKNTEVVTFDVEASNKEVAASGMKSSETIRRSIEQHANMVIENAADIYDALDLIRILEDDIADRVRRYCYCITNTTRSYREWLHDDYKKRLKSEVSRKL